MSHCAVHHFKFGLLSSTLVAQSKSSTVKKHSNTMAIDIGVAQQADMRLTGHFAKVHFAQAFSAVSCRLSSF